MTGRQKTLIAMGAAAAVLVATMTGEPVPLYIWNASPSVATGLYRVVPARRFHVAEVVAVRPPEPLATFLSFNGYLPARIPMLKRVLAMPGQTICRIGPVIFIDDIAVGAARDRDRRGRLLPKWQGCRVVAEGELFFMNWQSDDSLDGRYFGLLPASSVIGRALPVWTGQE